MLGLQFIALTIRQLRLYFILYVCNCVLCWIVTVSCPCGKFLFCCCGRFYSSEEDFLNASEKMKRGDIIGCTGHPGMWVLGIGATIHLRYISWWPTRCLGSGMRTEVEVAVGSVMLTSWLYSCSMFHSKIMVVQCNRTGFSFTESVMHFVQSVIQHCS